MCLDVKQSCIVCSLIYLLWLIKAEGAKPNTPPKTNTYKRLPLVNALLPGTIPNGVGVRGPT